MITRLELFIADRQTGILWEKVARRLVYSLMSHKPKLTQLIHLL